MNMSKSKSFTEATSEAVAKQLSTSMSSSDTTGSEQYSSSSDTVQASTGFSAFGVKATVNYGHSWERGSSSSKSHTYSKESSGTRSKSYNIYKTVNLPPYSAVKISSYANWIDYMSVSFTMNLKFTVKSFRRKMNGEGTNASRTMDLDFVKYLKSKEKFPVKIIKTRYDIVIGQIQGNMKASVGLESVSTAHETRLEN